jgi:4-phytase/acid phosphatase
VTNLGRHYASAYKAAWPSGFKAFLWADVDPRTRDTAAALAAGLQEGGVPDVTVASLEDKVDPLFHPFKALCGKPDSDRLARIAKGIETSRRQWAAGFRSGFVRLEDVLACRDTSECKLPLEKVTDTARGCPTAGECEAPLDWKGRFSYASSASEAFLLEFANGMPPDEVGWGRVPVIPPAGAWNARTMLRLHEFYFDKTERDPYVAAIQASNLVREVLDLIERRAGGAVEGCPHADAKSRFVGLVGHDTNLAGVGALLGLGWRFDDESLPRERSLPPDMLHLRHDGALPAGALVFELRRRAGRHFVRLSYIAQSPGQMREAAGEPFRLAAWGRECRGQPRRCEMSLETFRSRARRALVHREFLSHCDAEGRQSCAAMRAVGEK